MSEFRDFLLNESRYVLGQKVGDILNAMQELADEGPHMGKRQLVRHTEKMASLIRRIIHGSWQKKVQQHLKTLQKVGVALMKAIEEKDNLEDVLSSSSQELQSVLKSMGVPIHQMLF